MKALKLLLQADTNEAQSQLQIDAQKELDELIALIQPFAEAYRLHLRDDRRVSELKTVMAKDTSVEEWQAAFVALYGAVPVPVEEQVNG